MRDEQARERDFGKPLAVTIPHFCSLVGVRRTSAYKLIRDQEVETLTIAGRRLVLMESIESLIERSRQQDA